MKCKYCQSENLILEPRIKNENVLTGDMVALKCCDCGKWLKWCPKDERPLYIKSSHKIDYKQKYFDLLEKVKKLIEEG